MSVTKIRLSLFILAFVLLLVCSIPALTQPFELNGKAGLLMDARSGQIFFEHNIDEPLPIASVTKIMTLVLILEALDRGLVSLTDLVSTTAHAASMGGSQVWLEPGEQLPLKEILFAISVGSANDAAVAVAEYIAGSEQAFVDAMNKRAQELGLTNSQFSNASGLPPSQLNQAPQLMSVRDIATLTQYAITVPLLMDFVSTYEYTMRAQTTKRPQLWNYNKLLRRYQGVDGVKTGYTTESGYCLAATAERNGLRLIAVVLGAACDANREEDIRKLLDYGYRKYTNHLLISEGTEIGQLVLKKGDPERVSTILANDLFVTIERGDDANITTQVQYREGLQLPMYKGIVVGDVVALLNNEEIARAHLTIARDVDRGSIFDLIFRMSNNMIKSLLNI